MVHKSLWGTGGVKYMKNIAVFTDLSETILSVGTSKNIRK